MAGGRPRTVSFSPEEMVELGKEMIEWLYDHPETLHLCEWYSLQKRFTYNQWKVMQVKEEFHPYYEAALNLIGIKYLNKDSKVRDGISQRWQRVYFKDLRDSEDKDLDDAAIRSLKASEEQTDEQKAKFDSSMLQVINLLSSDRKIDDSNISNDTKS